jgi:hypothetical protein
MGRDAGVRGSNVFCVIGGGTFMKAVSILVVAIFGVFCASAFAGVGNDMPSGEHYNLNIIGTSTSHDVGDSQGHTLFVLLDGKTRIYMTQDPDGQFEVVDRDGTDGRAQFNIAPGYYDVYARALGKPNGDVHIESWGEFEDDTGTSILKLGEVDLTRERGKPQTVNLNHLFYVDVTLVVNGEMVDYNNTWVFDIEELLEYYWEYDNSGLKLLQVRFYPRF